MSSENQTNMKRLPGGMIILVATLVLASSLAILANRTAQSKRTAQLSALIAMWNEPLSEFATTSDWGALQSRAIDILNHSELNGLRVYAPEGLRLLSLAPSEASSRIKWTQHRIEADGNAYRVELGTSLPTSTLLPLPLITFCTVMSIGFAFFALWQVQGRASAESLSQLLHRHLPTARIPAPAPVVGQMQALQDFLNLISDHTAQLIEAENQANSAQDRLSIQLRDSQASEVMSRQRSRRLQGIFQQSAQGMGFLSAQGHILELNQAAQTLVQLPIQDLRGKGLWTLTALGSEEELKTWIDKAVDGEIVRQQLEIESQGKALHVIDLNLKPLRDENGKIEMLIFEAHNITDRIRAQKALHETVSQFQQSQKMEAIGRLAGGIAHDFNNLLTSILGFSNMVLDQVRDQPGLAEDMDEVVQAATRAQNLTKKLLAMSRQDTPDSQVFDLNNLIKELENMMRVTLHEDIDYVSELSDTACMIDADVTSLEQVIVNLAVNARDAMPRSGRLYISTNVETVEASLLRKFEAGPGEYVCLRVRDTGCGMEPDVLEHIYEPFFTTKASGQGTGLGLSTVYAIVQQYKGFIDIDSEPGVGTEFKVYFPAANANSAKQVSKKSAQQASDQLPGGTETILLVEDENGVRRMAGRMITDLGYSLIEAADGEQGARVAETHDGKIDLIITDVVMPNLSGPEMIDRLRVKIGYIPHLYVSGFTQDKLKQHGAEGSEHRLIRKPYSKETLANRIRQELDRELDEKR